MKTKIFKSLIASMVLTMALAVPSYASSDLEDTDIKSIIDDDFNKSIVEATPIPVSTPTPTKVVKNPNPLTPDGNMQLVDEATDEDGKLFYTVETRNGFTFYLIIDEERNSDNVYFLNMVDESDLLNIIEGEYPEEDKYSEPVLDFIDEEESTEVIEEDKKTTSNKGGVVFLLLIAVGAIGGAFYLKYKDKLVNKKKDHVNDDYEFMDEEDIDDGFFDAPKTDGDEVLDEEESLELFEPEETEGEILDAPNEDTDSLIDISNEDDSEDEIPDEVMEDEAAIETLEEIPDEAEEINKDQVMKDTLLLYNRAKVEKMEQAKKLKDEEVLQVTLENDKGEKLGEYSSIR